MKFTIIALLSALAAIGTAEFCDNGAADVGACENIDENTFCVNPACVLPYDRRDTNMGSNSAWTIRLMRFRPSGTAWQIPRARLVRVGHEQNTARGERFSRLI